jgi:acyl-CoA thioester hydrolase
MAAPFFHRARIRFIDTDASQRIHYTALFRYFEAAEEEFLRSLGHGFKAAEDGPLGFPRVHAECDISGKLVHDDEIELTVSVEHVGRSSYTLGYRVSATGAEVARGRVVVVCMDRATQRSTEIPPDFASALRAQMSE